MGKKMNRKPRTRSTPPGDDQQTQMEVEMGSSGRTDAVPRERLFGPHHGRFETESAREAREHGDTVTREALRQAAAKADRNVIGHDVPSRSR